MGTNRSFHKEAAKVLRLALSRQTAEAKQCMAGGGSFATASTSLTAEMMNWKKALGA